MDVVDALGEKAGHGNDLQLRAHVQTFTGRDRVGDDDLGEHRVVEPLEGGAGKHAVRGTGVHFAGTFAEQDFGSGADRPCRIDDVIHEYRDLAVHIADDVRGGRLVGAVAALVDDGEGRFAKERARSTPPASGETTTISPFMAMKGSSST